MDIYLVMVDPDQTTFSHDHPYVAYEDPAEAQAEATRLGGRVMPIPFHHKKEPSHGS